MSGLFDRGVRRTVVVRVLSSGDDKGRHIGAYLGYWSWDPLAVHIDIPRWGRWQVCRQTFRDGMDGKLIPNRAQCVVAYWASPVNTKLDLWCADRGEYLTVAAPTVDLSSFLRSVFALVPQGQEEVDISDADFMVAKWAAEAGQ